MSKISFLSSQVQKITQICLVGVPETVFVFPETPIIPKFLRKNVEAMGVVGIKFSNEASLATDKVVKCANLFEAVAKMVKSVTGKIPDGFKGASKFPAAAADLSDAQRRLLGIFIPFEDQAPREAPTVVEIDDTVAPVEKLPSKPTKVISRQGKSKVPVSENQPKITVTNAGIDPEDQL